MIFFSGAYSLEILFMFGNTEESQAQAILDLRGIKFLRCGIYFSSPSCWSARLNCRQMIDLFTALLRK